MSIINVLSSIYLLALPPPRLNDADVCLLISSPVNELIINWTVSIIIVSDYL